VEGFNLDEIGIILDGLQKVEEQGEEFIRSFDIEGENDEDVNAEKLLLQKSKVLTNYFEQMKFHIEECQQKMSEIE
jgi:DNA-binding transcriptional MerR regulator